MICKKAVVLAFFVFLAASSIACFTRNPLRDYARAQQLQRDGKTAPALAAYRTVLAHLQSDETHWRSETYFQIGECLFQLGETSDAYAAFRQAAEVDDTNAMAHLRLGEMLLASGSVEKASDQAKLVLASGEASTEAMALLGAAAAASGNSDVAQQAFRQVLEADPSRLTVAMALADIYNRADRPDDARQVLKKAASAQPTSASPWLALGRLEEQEGRVEAAEAAYRKATAVADTPETNLRLAQFLERSSRIPEAEQLLRRVDAQSPAMPTALPDFEAISGRAPNALDKYLAVLNSASGVKTVTAENGRGALAARLVEADLQAVASKRDEGGALQRARIHLERYRRDMDGATAGILEAELALTSGDLPLAEKRAEHAVALAPESAPAHYVLGLIKLRAADVAAAHSEWLAALDADPHFVPVRLALAADALDDHDAANAETYIVPVVQDEPANLEALNLFARALAAQKRYASAALIARRALAVDSTAAEPHLIMADVALQQHLLGEALVHFEQAVLLDPHSRPAIEGLTQVYRAGVITRPMLKNMEKVALSDPPSATVMEITGRLYAERGWYADAERCLQRALQLDPHRSTAARALAQTQAVTGRYDAAMQSAARAGGDSQALLQAFEAEERNDIANAIRSYEAALRRGENTGTAANNLAWILAQRGTDLERALSLAEKARSLNPANPAVLDTLGVVRLRRREYSMAVDLLESARRLATAQPEAGAREHLLQEINHHLAEAYVRAGQPRQAAMLNQE